MRLDHCRLATNSRGILIKHITNRIGLLSGVIRDPGLVFFDWSNFKKQEYDDRIRWVLQGIEFAVDHNKFWMDR
jgi:hypothetical protein